jgi:hypothetical protein
MIKNVSSQERWTVDNIHIVHEERSEAYLIFESFLVEAIYL